MGRVSRHCTYFTRPPANPSPPRYTSGRGGVLGEARRREMISNSYPPLLPHHFLGLTVMEWWWWWWWWSTVDRPAQNWLVGKQRPPPWPGRPNSRRFYSSSSPVPAPSNACCPSALFSLAKWRISRDAYDARTYVDASPPNGSPSSP